MLYQLETSEASPAQVTTLFWRCFEGDPEGREYAESIVSGVDEDRAELDSIISRASTRWRIDRMPRVDRNLLRLGAWELLRRSDIPRAVVIDEAVELAKVYGSEESRGFVNGVLNRIADDLGRDDGAR